MTIKNLNNARMRYYAASVFALVGYASIWYAAGFLITAGIFLVHTSINVERSADKLRGK